MGVEVDDADRSLPPVLGDRGHVRVGDGVVAAQDDRDRPGCADLADPPAHLCVALGGVSGNGLGVAVVDDPQLGERIDPEPHVRPCRRDACGVVRRSDRTRPVAAPGAVRDRLVERRAEDRDVHALELGRVEHERQLREGRDAAVGGLVGAVGLHGHSSWNSRGSSVMTPSQPSARIRSMSARVFTVQA